MPNLLTGLRIALIPLIAVLIFVPGITAAWMGFGLYAVAAISDFFDGFLSRHWSVQSSFGRVFDPIADKLLVGAVLLCLVATGRVGTLHLIPVIAILLRELLVSGLREYLGSLGIILPVSPLAKWKTATQLVALAFLLLMPAVPVETIGLILLWAAAALSLITGWEYLKATMKHLG